MIKLTRGDTTQYVFKSKINYIVTYTLSSNGYVYQKTYVIEFHLDNGEILVWKTYDQVEFDNKLIEVNKNDK